VTLRLDRRIVPDEDSSAAGAALRGLIENAVAGMDGIAMEVRRVLLAAPLTTLPGADRLSRLLCHHAGAVFGEPVSAVGSPLYTDARHYAAAGVPVVLYGAGPRTIELANAHRADERLDLADLPRATEVVARTLADLLSPG